MSMIDTQVPPPQLRRRIRNGALGLVALAIAFYVGFIVLLVHHSHR